MAQNSFSQIPQHASKAVEPFHVSIPDEQLTRLQTLLDASPIGPSTYENNTPDKGFGITRLWLANAKEAWMHDFNWRRHEQRINSIPNFKVRVDGLDIHFLALFSARPDAIPVILMHGWPGSFMELVPLLELLSGRYTPETLPFHAIVPSLPGYGFSEAPLDRDFGLRDAAKLMDRLMTEELGFDGYVAYGGDVGSMIASLLSSISKACKALHVTYLAPNPTTLPTDEAGLDERERQHLARVREWRKSGMGYALEQGTRPASIGLALSSSPLALLAWIGEKFLEWVDEPLPLDDILGIVTLYWLTSSYPRTIWSYRSIMKEGARGLPTSTELPLGYSLFARELGMVPRSWAEKLYPNLIAYTYHDKGGHFPGLERPGELLEDIEKFVQNVSQSFRT